MMSETTAIFIGGAFDMTKRIVSDCREIVCFCEPIEFDLNFISGDTHAHDTVECRILEYMFVGKTPNGVAMYEFHKRA
jgi:hypothetical protein